MLAPVLVLALLLVLPQLAGLLVTRLARRTTWVAWPAAAISVFGAAFYLLLWAPTRAAEEASGCGMRSLGLAILLIVGLVLHLGTGTLFGLLARRAASGLIRRRTGG